MKFSFSQADADAKMQLQNPILRNAYIFKEVVEDTLIQIKWRFYAIHVIANSRSGKSLFYSILSFFFS